MWLVSDLLVGLVRPCQHTLGHPLADLAVSILRSIHKHLCGGPTEYWRMLLKLHSNLS